VEKVADRASFDSSSPSVATVSPDGVIKVVGVGEATVMVRFLDRVAVCRIQVPYAAPDAAAFSSFKPRGKIDEMVLARWKLLGLPPANVCTDADFLRRIYLDVLGLAPPLETLKAFLADTHPDKRDRAIDAVLARPEYADYWAYKWGDLLRNNRNLLQEKGMWAFHRWLKASFRDNVPFDKFVAELLTATGSPYQEGPANFFRVGNQPEDWAENTAQVFLGVRVQCARCHHHPFENISQADYFGMAAFFSRLASKPSGEFGIYGQDRVVYVRDVGEARHPRTGQTMRPQPLGGKPVPAGEADPFDRRRDLVKWLADAKNPALAKNVVNRYWGYLFGRGLVHPIDDIRVTNPASCPELFDYLAADLIERKYDVKQLIRELLRSQVYQLASVGNPASAVDADNKYFARYTPKRLTAEQLLDSIDYACGTQERFNGLPDGFRASSLPDTTFGNRFLDAFGRPRREVSCECERGDSPNMAQALQLLTGSLLNRKVQDPAGRISKLAKAKTKAPDAVREIYLTALCRSPSESELAEGVALVASAPSLKEGLEDFLWAMLNTREFQFNR
ncbi:MAG TPA: DUF1549 and DUF1553 domain-containing protein, partial [Planctomycetia bacterium]|nr:DUF1549 and DUF1553 domain-containing protein [Planctomycetia bacterium]